MSGCFALVRAGSRFSGIVEKTVSEETDFPSLRNPPVPHGQIEYTYLVKLRKRC